MITRSKMRRQLYRGGGITGLYPRVGFGAGSWLKERIRKLIPNELADIAVKAAPFVAPFNAPVAGLMRGIGRFDQRGSLSDALKQGLATTAFGAGTRYLGGQRGMGDIMGFGTPGDRFSSPISADSPLRDIFKARELSEKERTAKEIAEKKSIEKTPGFMQRATEATIGKVPGLRALPPMVQQKLLVGGAVSGASTLASYFKGDFRPQEEGESREEYLAARKDVVGKQMRIYMDNYFKFDPEYSQLDNAGRNAFVARYNVAQGGRIGYGLGDLVRKAMPTTTQPASTGISMGRTLAQNIAANKAQAESVGKMLEKGRAQQVSNQLAKNITSSLQGETSNPFITGLKGYFGMGEGVKDYQSLTGNRPDVDKSLREGILAKAKNDALYRVSQGDYTIPKSFQVGYSDFQGAGKPTTAGKYASMWDQYGKAMPAALMGDPESILNTTQGISTIALDPEGKIGARLKDRYDYNPFLDKIASAMGGGAYEQDIGLPEDFSTGIYDVYRDIFAKAKARDAGQTQQAAPTAMSEKDFYNSFWGVPWDDMPKWYHSATPEQEELRKKHFPYSVHMPHQMKRAVDLGVYTPYEGPTEYAEYLKGFNQGGRVGLRHGTPEAGTKSLDAGAPDITYEGERPAKKQEMKMAGPDWYIKRIENLMYNFDMSYEEASEIAYDSDKYYEVIGHDARGPVLPSPEDPINPFAPKPTGPVLPDKQMAAKGGRIKYRMGTGPAGLPGIPRMAPDGMEYDMRMNGGFQGLGAKEGKDDVPAMLAKNEFVFTADAVRGAGNGDIELGAQRMYDTMKNLEKRVV